MDKQSGSLEPLPLPWQEANWQRLLNCKMADRMPHAVLLTGGVGLGKAHFAHLLAQSLLCSSPDEQGGACGTCRSCQLLRTDVHPDLTLIEPEEAGKSIKIDAIREFTRKSSLTSQSGGYKVIILQPADALNSAAANSLLKTLEEPVERTLIILVTAHPGRLPATIRSRCQGYHFPPPSPPVALQWLKQTRRLGSHEEQAALLLSLASGGPLLALAYAADSTLDERAVMIKELIGILKGEQNPVITAQRWSSLDQRGVVKWFSGWVIDIIRLKIASQSAEIINIDQRQRLQALALKVNSKKIYALMDRLIEANRTIGTQLNAQMQLESLLLDWAGIGAE